MLDAATMLQSPGRLLSAGAHDLQHALVVCRQQLLQLLAENRLVIFVRMELAVALLDGCLIRPSAPEQFLARGL
jgi:hypothetical protein